MAAAKKTGGKGKTAKKKNPANPAIANGKKSGRGGRYKRNPSSSTVGLLSSGLIGAVGSIGIEYALRILPQPASPLAQAGVQGGVALAIHTFGRKMPGGQTTADTIALIILAFAFRNLALQMFPVLSQTPVRLGVAVAPSAPAIAEGNIAEYMHLPEANLNDYVYIDEAVDSVYQ